MLIHRLLMCAAFMVSGLLALSLAGCEGMDNPLLGDPGGWEPEEAEYVTSSTIEVPEFDFLWERAKFMIQTERYGIDGGRTRRDKKHLVSRWKTMLSPVRFKGVRRRVWMDFEEVGENKYIVRCAVQAQRNTVIESPTQASNAVWKELEGGDVTRANVILYKLEAGFASEDKPQEPRKRRR